jgi:DUF1680 family protein
MACIAAVPMLLALLPAGTAMADDAQSSITQSTSSANNVLDLGFDGDLTDASAAANTVAEHKGTASYTEGVSGQALALSDGALSLGASRKLQPSDLTLSFWYKPSKAMSGEQILMWSKGQYNENGWYLSANSEAKPLVLSVGVGANGSGSGQPMEFTMSGSRTKVFPVNTWTHVMVTFDSAAKTAKFFINGEGKASAAGNTSSPGVITADDTTKYIGWNGTHANGGKLNGALDEVKLFNVAGTSADVEREVSVGNPDFDATALAQAALDTLSVAQTATSNLTLDTDTVNGSTIAWSSDNAGVVSDTGIVTRPAAGGQDATATLTATAAFGSKAVSKTFTVTVPAQSESGSTTYSKNLLAENGMDNVEITDEYLSNAGDKEIKYLLSFDTDRLLVEFRKQAGLDTKGAKNYGGWERGYGEGNRFTGHFVGHYISAIAEAQHSTIATAAEKKELATKLTAMVTGLREAQEAYAAKDPSNAGFLPAFKADALPGGKDGLLVPFYNLHKVEQGLIHAYDYAEDQETRDTALAAAGDFADFIVTWKQAHPSVNMLATEYGGMNDALYQLYQITGDANHLTAAHYFDEDKLFAELAKGTDNLNGKHANTTIPKLTGAVQRYIALTENKEAYAALSDAEKTALSGTYLKAAENFWTMVKDNRSYVNGDNSQSEHFHVSGDLWQDATQNSDADGGYHNNSTSETCNAHNMLKLTRLLFEVTKDAKYSEYYETTYINSIISSQNPETGMTTYFQPMKAGYPKVFGTEYGEFWCCQGTGIENFSKLGDSFYFTDDENVYVNMFRSSTFSDKRHGLKITQTADVPKQDTVTYKVDALKGAATATGTANLKLRVPDWSEGATLTVDGNTQSTKAKDENGWLTVAVKAGTQISYKIPSKLQTVSAPDNQNWIAFQYGPVALAGALTETNAKTNYAYGGILVRVGKYDATANAKASIVPKGETKVADWLADIDKNLVRTDDPKDGKDISFEFRNVSGDASTLKLQPYYTLYESTYALYFDMADVDSETYQNIIVAEKETARDEARTSDSVTPDQGNNVETTANLQRSADSESKDYNGKIYRDAKANGWFSYDLKVDAKAEHNYVNVQYNTADNTRSFDIYIDPTPIDTTKQRSAYNGELSPNARKLTTVKVNDAAGSKAFYWEHYEIPSDLAAQVANGKARIMFKSSGGMVGGVYGVQTLTKLEYSTNAKLKSMSFDTGTLSPKFSSAESSYTLTVPAKTTAVNADFTLADAGSYLMVDGIVIDDSKTRAIKLDGDSTVVEFSSYAEDHTTVKHYTVTILIKGASAPEQTGPVVKYDFNSDATVAADAKVDNSGSAGDSLDGTISDSGASLVDDGNGGKALALAGGAKGSDSAYVSLPGGVVSSNQKDMTVRMSVAWDGNNSCTWPIAMGKSNKDYLAYIMNCGSNTRVEASKNGAKTALSQVPPAANEKVDVVVVVKGGKSIAYYADGKLVKQVATTLTASDFIGSGALSGYLGKSFYDDPYFGGTIDDFTVWNRAVGTAELFEETTPVTPVTPATDEERKPLAERIAAIESEKLNKSDYTADSWSPFSDALAKANASVADAAATKADIDAALNELNAARDGLTKTEAVPPAGDGDGDDKQPGGDQSKDKVDGSDSEKLTDTGAKVSGVAIAAIVLLVAGAGAVLLSRRRARE